MRLDECQIVEALIGHCKRRNLRLSALRAYHRPAGSDESIQPRILRLRLRMTERSNSSESDSEAYGAFYPALFTRTTVIFSKPSSKTGGFSFSAMRRITSSLTERSR